MVLDYAEKETELGPVIERAQEIPPKEGGFDDSCTDNPVCTSAGVLAQVGKDYGLSVNAGDNWSKDDLWNALKSEHPIIVLVRVGMNLKKFGHFVVVVGLDLDTEEVFYHDPLGEPMQHVSWEQFDAVWESNVDDKDPLQPEGHVRWGMTGH
jgi:ABC-type bacteriocin/lantibiotic exporter with double-glycine peptidase domain